MDRLMYRPKYAQHPLFDVSFCLWGHGGPFAILPPDDFSCCTVVTYPYRRNIVVRVKSIYLTNHKRYTISSSSLGEEGLTFITLNWLQYKFPSSPDGRA